MAAQSIPLPNEPPVEIKAVIDKALGGFNRKDSTMYNSAFSADVVIIGDVAPYRWTGPNAQGRWLDAAEKYVHDLDVTDDKITYDRYLRTDVDGTHALAVLTGKLSYTVKGREMSRQGILTFTLAKEGNAWKIESQTWSLFS